MAEFIEVTFAKWHSPDYTSSAPDGSVALVNIASIKYVDSVVKVVGYPKAKSEIVFQRNDSGNDDYAYVEESYDEIKAALDVAGCTIILLASDRMAAKEAENRGR